MADLENGLEINEVAILDGLDAIRNMAHNLRCVLEGACLEPTELRDVYYAVVKAGTALTEVKDAFNAGRN